MGRGARGHARAPRLGAARRRRAPARRAPAARRSAALDRRGRAGDAHVPTPHAALAADPPGCQRRRRGVPAAPVVACDGDRLHGEQSAAVRAGEFARAYVAQQQLPVRFSTALASVGVERVFDGLLLVGLMTLAIASPAFPGHARIGTTSVSGLATGAAVFFSAVLVVAVLVVHRPAPWLALLRRVTHALLPARFAGRLTQVAEGLVAGLEVLKSPTR